MTAEGELLPELTTAVPGPRGVEWIEALAQAECPALTTRRARRQERSGAAHDPIVWTRALGANVWDADANRYVDLSAGFGAAAVGHCHPRVVEATQRQAAALPHALGDLSPSVPKIELLTRLAALGPWPEARVMLGLNGGDAVTCALKTAALFGGKHGVIAFEGGYHGLEYGPLAACGFSAGFRVPFAPQLNPHVGFAPYPGLRGRCADEALDAVKRMLASDGEYGCVLVEPVLGRGGVIAPPGGFIAELARLCHANDALLICDEVMTGCGRAGAMLASVEHADAMLASVGRAGAMLASVEHAGTRDALPDLICLGKALGGGLPVSACIGSYDVMRAWGDPQGEALHTSTFAGNPLGCAAALATLDVIEQQALCERSGRLGSWLVSRLSEALGERAKDVRGAGLLVGVELHDAGRALAAGRALLERGYITVPAGDDARIVSLTPPLTITRAQLDGFVAAFAEVLA